MKPFAEDIVSRANLRLLGRCLDLQPTQERTAALRENLRIGGYLGLADVAVRLRLEPATALALNERGLLPALPKISLPGGRVTITKLCDDIVSNHFQRREAMRKRLLEIIVVLCEAHIVPTLIKGARSLWTGEPTWRSLRDLDILVQPGDARRAQDLISGMGYKTLKRNYFHFGKHHFPELFRADLPGWVEVHRALAVRFAEKLLPSEVLLGRQDFVSLSEMKVGLLQTTDNILQGLVHHHFHHDEFRNQGWLDVKGLYEFAWDIEQLDDAGRTDLLCKASAHPRLLAALDLWLAAAADLFDCPVREPLKIYPDAATGWSKALERMTERERTLFPYPGHLEEFRLCFDQSRLDRVKAAGTITSHTRAKLTALGSLANNSYPNTIVLPRRWL